MTVISEEKPSYTLFVLPESATEEIELFELPHPSNNESKKSVTLFVHDSKVYQLKTKQFSKGCQHNAQKDFVSDKYHYSTNSQPFKSTFIINEAHRSDGYTVEQGAITYSEVYDLTFSICSYYYRNNRVPTEDHVFVEQCNSTAGDLDSNYYTINDYQEKLIHNHNSNWSKIPVDLWTQSLSRISETVEEAGETFYRISAQKIQDWLLRKVIRIKDNFPKSLPIPSNLPTEMIPVLQSIMSANLLVSLIPQNAYQLLVSAESPELNLKQCYQSYESYLNETVKLEKEKEILIKAAMSTGLPNGQKPIKKAQSQKPKLTKPKVAKGKGRIDGFFKRTAA